MSGRSIKILSRFPAHMEATRPGKQLAVVAGALSADLDVLSADLAAVRTAHRLAHADRRLDVLRLGGLHGLTLADMAVVIMRFERARQLIAELEAAADDTARDEAAEALCALWGLDATPPILPLYAPPVEEGEAPDLEAARARLLEHAREATQYADLVEALRTRVAEVCRVHAGGNGTVRALLEAAANALDLELDEIQHSEDRFWHAAFAYDRLALTRPVQAPSEEDPDTLVEVSEPFPPAQEVIGLEENPLRRYETDTVGRKHGDRFIVRRRGFSTVLLRVRVVGRENRTYGPMVVNRDEGHGIGYMQQVPSGKSLIVTEEGRLQLEGADVTSFGYAWEGACFADADALHKNDFLFDGDGVDPGRRAVFVTTYPEHALDREAAFPHSGSSLPMPGVAVGETRMAFFIRQAHLCAGGTPETPAPVTVVAAPFQAIADATVFAAGPGETLDPQADLQLSWLEHEAYAVRVWIPRRFEGFVAPEEAGSVPDVPSRMVTLLGRFKPAGIRLEVLYVDDQWILGSGYLPGADDSDPISRLRATSVLWPSPAVHT